jgi:tricorn protease
MRSRLFTVGFILIRLTGESAAGEIPDGAVEMQMVTAPAVSPDGKSMVFEWIDDLWIASTNGGEAVRVEENPAREAFPQFTPDGKRIVFSSDRTGSMQIYSISVNGGNLSRHTWQTEGNELECISPDSSHAIIRGNRERSGVRATGLFTISLTADEREQRLFDASGDSATWSPDGKRVLFCTGGEQLYRKGYRGARASQIWQFEISSGKFECKVAEDTAARLPCWHPDGKGFHYLAGRSGTLNLWSMRDDDASASEAVTHEKEESVIMRTPPADRCTFVYHCGSVLFRFKLESDAAAVPLALWTRESLPDVSHERKTITATTSADFLPGTDRVIFAAGGELWSKSGPAGDAVRLTRTAEAEGDVQFSPDGKWLYFLRDDGLQPNYFRARPGADSLTDEYQVTRGTRLKSRLTPSPDGSRIAWVEGTGDVFTAAADGSDTKRVYQCWDRPTFDWSPEGGWLAIAAEDRNSNRDIWLCDAAGKARAVNLTINPAFEGSPRWSPDGRWLAFSAKRDVGGKTALWTIDFGKDGLKAEPDRSKLRRLADEARLIPTDNIEPTRVIWAADSKSLLFQNKKSSDSNLYAVELTSGTMKSVTSQRGIPIRMDDDDSLLWRVNQTPAILKGAKSALYPISVFIDRPRSEILTIGFRRIWKTLGERFYDANMNGNDWEQLRKKYESAAAMSRTSRQFDRVVSQLFGELNASHLSFLRKPWPNEILEKKDEETTAHPGLVFRDGAVDGPLVIERVIKESHVALVPNPPEAGEMIVRIAGEGVTSHTPLHKFLNGGLGKSLPLLIRGKDGKERVIELRCISYAKARSLDRNSNKAAARRSVTKSGKFSYIVVKDMNMESFNTLELEVYRESLESTGMILDFRNNGGGREADRMLSLFCQPQHSFTIPRGGPRGYPNDRLVHAFWDKPLVVICNENTFSNAEIFCHAMSQTKRAPLVGVSTAGGVISAVKESIPDVGELQVPFRGWFQSDTGENLDLNGAKPDFPVRLTPADEDKSLDPQLEKAIEVLRKELAGDAKPVEPIDRK